MYWGRRQEHNWTPNARGRLHRAGKCSTRLSSAIGEAVSARHGRGGKLQVMDGSAFFEPRVSTRGGGSKPALRRDVLQALELGARSKYPDLEVAGALAELAAQEFGAFVREKQTLSNSEIAAVVRALRATVDRLDISFTLPWRDFESFRGHWEHNGAIGSGAWAARRTLIKECFNPLTQALARKASSEAAATPVTMAPKSGWSAIDDEIQGVRELFDSATTTKEFRDVGNRCVATLEAMSRELYDVRRHLRDGETEPPVGNTKDRLERYVEDSIGGADYINLRGLARKVIVVAQEVKHSRTPSRREAGIAADSVILLASILRRVNDAT